MLTFPSKQRPTWLCSAACSIACWSLVGLVSCDSNKTAPAPRSSPPAVALNDPTEPQGNPVAVTSSADSRAERVEAHLYGIIVAGKDFDGKPVLEICARTRMESCPGVILDGDVPKELISQPNALVRVKATGSYDGDRLAVRKLEGLGPIERYGNVDRYRNPCPEYQTAKAGPANGNQSISDLTERVNTQYKERIAGVFWDRIRQTLTIRVTGDIDGLREKLNIAPGDQICLVGNAARSLEVGTQRMNEIAEKLHAGDAGFRHGGVDEVTGVVEIGLEAVDSETRSLLEKELGSDAKIDVFIELTTASLNQMPHAKKRGEVPLATGSSRSQTGGMHALGRFELHYDKEKKCVYLQTQGTDARIMPLLPFGYRIELEPLRIIDFDGKVVVQGGKTTDWGGGNIGEPPERFAPYACGATSAWSGWPSAEKEPER